MTRPEVLDCLRLWLERNCQVPAGDISEDMLIVEQRILSSLHLASLLLYIEHLRGAPIEIEWLQPGAFRSLAAIYQNFFGGAAHA